MARGTAGGRGRLPVEERRPACRPALGVSSWAGSRPAVRQVPALGEGAAVGGGEAGAASGTAPAGPARRPGGPATPRVPRRPGPLPGQQRLSSWRAQPGADAAVVGTWRGRSFLRGSAVPSAEGRAAGPRLGLAIAPRPRAPGTGGPEVILPELLLEAAQPVAQLVIYLPFLTVTFSKQRDEHFHLK